LVIDFQLHQILSLANLDFLGFEDFDRFPFLAYFLTKAFRALICAAEGIRLDMFDIIKIAAFVNFLSFDRVKRNFCTDRDMAKSKNQFVRTWDISYPIQACNCREYFIDLPKLIKWAKERI